MQVQPIYYMCEQFFYVLQETTFFAFICRKNNMTSPLHILHCLFQENKIIKIQAVWRGYKLRKMFLSLFHEPQPSFKVVKSFVHHLDFNADDYKRDLQLQVNQFFFL
jgi:hypothetical protein